MEDPAGFSFVLALTDEVMRIRDCRRAARHFVELVRSAGVAPSLVGLDKLALRAGASLAEIAPCLVMRLVRERVRGEFAGVVAPASPRALSRHIRNRQRQHMRLNLNVLGEAILGDEEAERRLQRLIELLGRPDVDYVSVKISSICAQLNVIDFQGEVDRLASRLSRLYDAALASAPGGSAPGVSWAKFVNLDMEEYRDLGLTLAVFRQVLDQDSYAGIDAGIVLQAYLPDSLVALEELCVWARQRHARSGGTVKVRIVKGANLAMEKVQAELAGWQQAPFPTKEEVDANYKRMLDVALDPANAEALRLGVASHNLFELSWAIVQAEQRGALGRVEVEMLEGMAPSSALAVRDLAGSVLLYAPIVERADMESAIAYLVRRLDENTGPDNYLAHQFSLSVGSPAWNEQAARFHKSVADRHLPVVATRRTQRRGAAGTDSEPPPLGEPFGNTPDTDFSLAANREWLRRELTSWSSDHRGLVPAVVAGVQVHEPASGLGEDPSHPGEELYRWVQADISTVDDAVAAARSARHDWARWPVTRRAEVVAEVGKLLAARRGKLVGAMAYDAGKTLAEADSEVSEAVDFAGYYARQALRLEREVPGKGATAPLTSARFEPLGTVVVASPWNFPLSIPAGGVLAAAVAGNAVILKPAPETVAVAWELATACWDAGMPAGVLGFLPCADDEAGRHLVSHPDIDAVVLTGAWETARRFLRWRPAMRLHAETSGKNAIVITATADLDAAVADLVRSAFGNAGQKCSAASLGIVEAGVYDDPAFRRQLADAASSLRVGPASELGSTMGPVIGVPSGALAGALAACQDGESWLVQPHQVGDNPRLWSPGIKLGVKPGSHFHLNECFGPVLGLMRAADLDEAISLQNQPPYGLTAGLHALDPAEISYWRERVQAGNLYVNRHITGAVVRRQPFGGWKRSVVGPGAKAGGPNYLSSLGRWSWEGPWPTSAEAEVAYRRHWHDEMSVPVDESGLLAESNVLRYLPLRRVLLRLGPGSDQVRASLALAAATALGVGVEVSADPSLGWSSELSGSGAVIRTEDEAAVLRRIVAGEGVFDKVRALGCVEDALHLAALEAGCLFDDRAVLPEPAVELLCWVREQAISETRHRHGNITARRRGLSARRR